MVRLDFPAYGRQNAAMTVMLAGTGITLCAFLLALMAAKRRKALGDTWLMAWFLVHSLFFASVALADHTGGLPGLGISLAGQIAALVLPPVQLVYVWRATTGKVGPALIRSAWILIGVGAVLALPMMLSTRSVSGAIVADGPAWILALPLLATLGMLYYPLAARRKLTAYRQALKQRLSNTHIADLGWAKLWISSTFVLLLAQLLVIVISVSGLVAINLHIGALLAAQIAQIAYAGFHGLTQSRVFGLASPGPNADDVTDKVVLLSAQADFALLQGFLRSSRAHQHDGLSAGQLADMIGWGPDRLSRAIRLGSVPINGIPKSAGS